MRSLRLHQVDEYKIKATISNVKATISNDKATISNSKASIQYQNGQASEGGLRPFN